jgi:hypothetical protein
VQEAHGRDRARVVVQRVHEAVVPARVEHVDQPVAGGGRQQTETERDNNVKSTYNATLSLLNVCWKPPEVKSKYPQSLCC